MRGQYAIFPMLLLLVAGCSGGKEDGQASVGTVEQKSTAPAVASAPMRKEFVIVRELVRQHELQQKNEGRLRSIEVALTGKFPLLPDSGKTEEEKRVVCDAKAIIADMKLQIKDIEQ